jgi:hypothetical protein
MQIDVILFFTLFGIIFSSVFFLLSRNQISGTMKNIQKFFFITFFLASVMTVQAQIEDQNQLIKKDTMEQDNTRLVKEKNIRDTTQYNPIGDTTTKNNKSKIKNRVDTMYLIPDSKKMKSKK